MSANVHLNLAIDLLNDQDFLLNDEELIAYLDDLYYPKSLKKDRIKRFRNH